MEGPLEHITVDDVVRTEGCRGGVLEFRDKHFPEATTVNVKEALAVGTPDEAYYIKRAAGVIGYGDGDGYGFSYGYGDGYGFSYGYGDGNGDGIGSGYGFGYGYGNGDGIGSGYGYDDGDGDGSGIGGLLLGSH